MTPVLSDTEKLVIEYAESLTMTPTTVDDELRSRLRAEFSKKQLAELTHFIAVENLRARFNRGFDIQPEGYAD